MKLGVNEGVARATHHVTANLRKLPCPEGPILCVIEGKCLWSRARTIHKQTQLPV